VPDFLDTCSNWLDSMCRDQLSQLVELRFGAASQQNVPATIGNDETPEDNGDGIVTVRGTRDYFIAVADYQLDGIVVMPAVGHLIVENGIVYEVVAPGDEPCVRPSDAYGRMWRIHTQPIGEE